MTPSARCARMLPSWPARRSFPSNSGLFSRGPNSRVTRDQIASGWFFAAARLSSSFIWTDVAIVVRELVFRFGVALFDPRLPETHDGVPIIDIERFFCFRQQFLTKEFL